MASATTELDAQPFPLSYVVVALMSVLAAWLVSTLASILIPSWQSGAYLLVAAAAIGAAVLIREAIARERPSAAVVAGVRARELLVLLLGVFPAALILRYLPWNPLGLVDMLLNIWFEPQTYIDGRDLLTVALLIGAWAFPIRALDDLERLVVRSRDIPRPSRDSDDLTALRFGLPDLTGLHRKLAGWVLTTLVILSVAVGVYWQAFGTGEQVFVGAAVLLYAALGFILLALANYELRRSRWLIEGVTPEGQSVDLWAIAGGGLTAGLTLLAVLAPAVLLLTVMRGVIALVLLAFFRLMHLMSMGAPGGSFGGSAPALPPPIIRPPPFVQQQQHPPSSMPGWLVPVAIALAVFLVGLGVRWFSSWLRRSGRGPKLAWLKPFAGLLAFLAGLGLSLRRWLDGLRAAAAALAIRVGHAPGEVAARVRRSQGGPGNSAAEQVRYWYGQMVRQGARSGLARRPGQTAAEYRLAVRRQLAAAGANLDELTDAYVEARYSGQDVAAARATAAQGQYRKVRQAMAVWLRRVRRGQAAPPGGREP